MGSSQIYIEAFKQLIPFHIKFKSTSTFQKVLGVLVHWYLPTYMSHYTTVIGRSIYFPSEALMDHPNMRFTVAHEVVHLLDQKAFSTVLFLLLYLSPQIFALGVLSFPWLGYSALWFLIFALPWPSIGRMHFEARAYGLELYLYHKSGYVIDRHRYTKAMTSSGYYFMSWFQLSAERSMMYYYDLASNGGDKVFDQVLETFDSCADNSAKSD